jgi:hypothetical protein
LTLEDPAKARARLEVVDKRARQLYDELEPIASRFEFERAPRPAETKGAPLVLILGNHSSGKSTFVNWLLGEEVQKTGLAPIDDGFTIIGHGKAPDEKDGAAIVSNPDLPYGDLERFGPQLVSHLKLKLRPAPLLEALSLVDSPGMIDAADGSVGRGYDFVAATRWFAERADVVLLMFDPDKPGTTGETLKVLNQALEGLEHKLQIVLNKVDRFGDIRDFARTYGALCWNLSKAIPRKDLPHIHNIYVPVPGRDEPAKNGLPLAAFDKARDEVVDEIKRAPSRRVDNVVSRLYEHARRLRVHATVCDRARREIDRARLRWIAIAVLMASATLGFAWASYTHVPGSVTFGAIAAGVVLAGAVIAFMSFDVKQREKAILTGVEGVFTNAFERELVLGDRADDLRALWKSVQDRTRRSLETLRPKRAPHLRRGEARRLEKLINDEIPALRAQGQA